MWVGADTPGKGSKSRSQGQHSQTQAKNMYKTCIQSSAAGNAGTSTKEKPNSHPTTSKSHSVRLSCTPAHKGCWCSHFGPRDKKYVRTIIIIIIIIWQEPSATYNTVLCLYAVQSIHPKKKICPNRDKTRLKLSQSTEIIYFPFFKVVRLFPITTGTNDVTWNCDSFRVMCRCCGWPVLFRQLPSGLYYRRQRWCDWVPVLYLY